MYYVDNNELLNVVCNVMKRFVMYLYLLLISYFSDKRI